jgi:hypothetical protein
VHCNLLGKWARNRLIHNLSFETFILEDFENGAFVIALSLGDECCLLAVKIYLNVLCPRQRSERLLGSRRTTLYSGHAGDFNRHFLVGARFLTSRLRRRILFASSGHEQRADKHERNNTCESLGTTHGFSFSIRERNSVDPFSMQNDDEPKGVRAAHPGSMMGAMGFVK